MNLKKLGLPVLCCGAAFLTSCGYTYNYKQTLTHDEAIEWVKKNYGESEAEFKKPKAIKSNWAFDGYISDCGKSEFAAYDYMKTHLTHFLGSYAYVTDKEIQETIVTTGISDDELVFKTKETILNDESIELSSKTFPTSLKGDNFDDVINTFYFSGINKYNCDYIVDNKDKTLEIKGSYNILYHEDAETYAGDHILHIDNCVVKFNSNGNIESFKFEADKNIEVRYSWIRTDASQQKSSDSIAITLYKYSSFEFNYEY